MAEKKRKKRKILSSDEWWEAHREQFERTERHYEELKAAWAREAAEKRARESAAEDAA